MLKKRFLLLMVLVVLLLIPKSFAKQEKNSVAELSDSFFTNINAKEFKNAASLFHYPPSYSVQDLSEDRNGVAKALEYFYAEFGAITEIEKDTSSEQFVEVSVGGGDLPYWQKYSESIRVVFRVKFAKEKKGFMIINFCKISDKFEIRSVGYALPLNKSKSKERINDVLEGLMSLDS